MGLTLIILITGDLFTKMSVHSNRCKHQRTTAIGYLLSISMCMSLSRGNCRIMSVCYLNIPCLHFSYIESYGQCNINTGLISFPLLTTTVTAGHRYITFFHFHLSLSGISRAEYLVHCLLFFDLVLGKM